MRLPAIVCLLAAGCGADPAAPAQVPPEPLALPCSLGADVGRAHGFRMTLEQELDAAAAAGPHAIGALFAESPGAMEDLLGLATRRDPVRVDTVVTCPDAPFLLHDGVVTDLLVGLATAIGGDARDADGGLRSLVLRGVYADWSDGWRIHVTPPRDAFAGMEVLHVDADVRASIARRWAGIDVTLTAVTTGDRLVLTAPPLEAPVVDRHAPLHTGFRLVEATVDGRRADVVLGTGGYLVIGGLRGVSRVRLRYEGPLPLFGENQAQASVLELHRWLPAIPFAGPVRTTVTVRHPAHETLVASLPPRVRAPDEGDDTIEDVGGEAWRVARLAGVTDRDPALVLLDRAPAARVFDDEAGSRIELLAFPALPRDGCAPALARIVAALAPIGAIGRVRVVALPAVYGRHGRRADDLVLVLRDKLVDLCTPPAPGAPGAVRARHAEAVALLAHELAHGWFGRRVRAADDEASAWWEAVSEYVSSWAIPPDAARALRRGWRDDYAEVADRDLVAMAERVPTSGALRDAISYDKGALLLAALEDRIGRDRMAAVLRHHVVANDGALGSWLDLVASTQAIAGSQAAGWLHAALFTQGWPAWLDAAAGGAPAPTP